MSTQTSLTNTSFDTPTTPLGTLEDNHELTERAREYGEQVIQNNNWPLEHVDLETLSWATSTQAKRRHGLASYNANGNVTITISEHTYENAGFEKCKETIRHELVHAWQYQNRGALAIITPDGLEDSTIGNASDETWSELGTRYEDATDKHAVKIETGHGASFKNWIPALDLNGRCSNHYTKTRDDYTYVCECPDCNYWWGKHRMCKTVRQTADGNRICSSCNTNLYLRVENLYLEHDYHYLDQDIKEFAGNVESDEAIVANREDFGKPRSSVTTTDN